MRVALRIDDIGASSKRFDVYSNRCFGLGNFLFLKYLPPFRAWGPYREMMRKEWENVLEILAEHQAKLSVAVTACWVEHDGRLTPFPEKYPEEARILKEGMEDGLIEIANHGLTHCVLEGMQFRPKFFSSNRRYHREFWEWIPPHIHHEHIKRSQEILRQCFETDIVSFVPPGNVYTNSTLEACIENGIRFISGLKLDERQGLKMIDNDNVLAFHDRELVLSGVDWLREKISRMGHGTEYVFLKEL